MFVLLYVTPLPGLYAPRVHPCGHSDRTSFLFLSSLRQRPSPVLFIRALGTGPRATQQVQGRSDPRFHTQQRTGQAGPQGRSVVYFRRSDRGFSTAVDPARVPAHRAQGPLPRVLPGWQLLPAPGKGSGGGAGPAAGTVRGRLEGARCQFWENPVRSVRPRALGGWGWRGSPCAAPRALPSARSVLRLFLIICPERLLRGARGHAPGAFMRSAGAGGRGLRRQGAASTDGSGESKVMCRLSSVPCGGLCVRLCCPCTYSD